MLKKTIYIHGSTRAYARNTVGSRVRARARARNFFLAFREVDTRVSRSGQLAIEGIESLAAIDAGKSR